ncbi:MAG: ScyD/ScyE family protein [Chloroflexota bacterium]|nr:ScyD/ScyE family protein [Chloroflexota bacterium]
MHIRWIHNDLRSRRAIHTLATVATILALFASLGIVAAQAPPGPPTGAPGGGPGGPPPPPSANVSVFATGLQGPRGLRFGPDGSLYVAEAGMGGTNSTVGTCEQVPNGVGPYTGGKTARISKIDASGKVTTVAQGLPSARDAMGAQSAVSGVADIEFIGGTLYALLSGGGCSHGNPDAPNAVLKVNADGTTTRIVDLSAYVKSHPAAKPDAEDFEPDGDFFSMTQAGGNLYAVEANRGELVKITPDGQASRVVDFSATMGHIVPTVAAYRDGNFYMSNLDTFPVTANSKVFKVTPNGDISVVAKGLSAVLGIAYDGQGRLYALQMSTVPNSGPVPGSGNIVRMTASGTWEVVASGLFFPTGMTFGPDGTLFVSNMGFGPPTGQIVKVNVNAAPTAAPPASSATAPAPAPPTAPSPASALPPAPPKTGAGSESAFIRRLGDG